MQASVRLVAVHANVDRGGGCTFGVLAAECARDGRTCAHEISQNTSCGHGKKVFTYLFTLRSHSKWKNVKTRWTKRQLYKSSRAHYAFTQRIRIQTLFSSIFASSCFSKWQNSLNTNQNIYFWGHVTFYVNITSPVSKRQVYQSLEHRYLYLHCSGVECWMWKDHPEWSIAPKLNNRFSRWKTVVVADRR